MMDEKGAEVVEAGIVPISVALPEVVLSRMRPFRASSM